jgi:uncharacterized protein YkwD
MLRIVLSVFGFALIANSSQAQQQYTENITRSRAVETHNYRIPTRVKSSIFTEPKTLPSVDLPSMRPAQPRPIQQPQPTQPRPTQQRPIQQRPAQTRPTQPQPVPARPTQPQPAQARPTQQATQSQPAPKNGTVLANISVNPKTERVPFSSSAPTQGSTRTTERVKTQTSQGTDGRITTKSTKVVTTVSPDGAQHVVTSYNTRVNMGSSPAKTAAVKTAAPPTSVKTNEVVTPPAKNMAVKTAAIASASKAVEPTAVATTFSLTQRNAANTGNAAAYLSQEEKKVLLLVNLVRADGAVFCKEYVDKFIRSNPAFQNNAFAQSLYSDLKKVKGLPPLRPSMKLCNSARAHAQDIGQKGMKGHQSSNGMKFDTRVARYVGSYRGLGENISYGNNHSGAIPVVLELLIDNNNKDYGHRRNILSTSFETIGISIQPHTKYGFTCVQDFGAGVD